MIDLPHLRPPTVEFGPGNPSSSVIATSDSLIEVETPTAAAGFVEVIVTGRSGSRTWEAGGAKPGGTIRWGKGPSWKSAPRTKDL